MDIAFCINDAYVKYVAVTVCSIFENNKDIEEINIHILTDGISKDNDKLLRNLINRYKGNYFIYIVDDSSLKMLKSTWSIYTWYRLLIPGILPNVKTCLYLDADVIVSGSLVELFNMPMDNVSLYAALDIEDYFAKAFDRLSILPKKRYFCAGVMLMNLEYWREHDITGKAIEYALKNDEIIHYPDQDTLNVICQDSKRLLPLKWGIINAYVCFEPFIKDNITEIEELIRDPRIIHYAGLAPWIIEKNKHFMRNHFFKYNKIAGNIIKPRHIFSGMMLFKHRVKRILTRLGVMNYAPYWTKPALDVETVKRLVDKLK